MPRLTRTRFWLIPFLAVGLGAANPPDAPTDRATLMAQHRGGVMRLLAHSAAGSIDPQINATGQFWQFFAFTYDGLLATRKVGGPAGLEVVPDLADSLPTISDQGRTYIFHLRSGVHFSTGRTVEVRDAVASFQRAFKVAGPMAGSFYGGIVGAQECLKSPTTCTLPGVSGDEATRTITIHLVEADSEFPIKLTLPPASILPADSPPHDAGTHPLPGTGAYHFVEYDPSAVIRMVRNPHFREWSAQAQPDGYPDEIRQDFGLEEEAAVTEVENGQADWMMGQPPADRMAELSTRFASQVHLTNTLALWYLMLNTRQPPFDHLQVRRAVNMAINRDAAVKLFGGHHLASPTCQILPPGLPGYAPYCPYAHDLEQARTLVAASGTLGQKITVITGNAPVERAIGLYVQSVLHDLGYQASWRALSGNIEFTYIQNSGNRVQIALTRWAADYPAESDFLHVLYACDAFQPDSDASLNMAAFCDPAIDARMHQAMTSTDPDIVTALWRQIDRDIVDQAPSVPLFTPKILDLVSTRVGNFTTNDQYHWLVSQSWVR